MRTRWTGRAASSRRRVSPSGNGICAPSCAAITWHPSPASQARICRAHRSSVRCACRPHGRSTHDAGLLCIAASDCRSSGISDAPFVGRRPEMPVRVSSLERITLRWVQPLHAGHPSVATTTGCRAPRTVLLSSTSARIALTTWYTPFPDGLSRRCFQALFPDSVHLIDAHYFESAAALLRHRFGVRRSRDAELAEV